tara:strand:- start:20189 stop:21517 length:1329 start_codon:yes stop_codon:yes gene_type:complete
LNLLETYHIPTPPTLKIKKAWIMTFFGVVILRLLLDLAYRDVVSVVFGYYNFKYEPSIISLIYSWVFLLALCPLIVKTIHRDTLSSNILSILILISLLPTSSLISFNSSYSLTYIIFIFVYWFLLLVFNLRVPTIFLTRKPIVKSYIPLAVISVILCGAVVYASWRFTGFRFHFGLIDVYDIRSDAREYSGPVLLGYLVTAADNILPVLLIFFLVEKRWTLAILMVVIILLNFGISAVKMIMFYLAFTLLCYVFIRSARVFRKSVWFLSFFVSVCILEFEIFRTAILTNFSLFRIFFIPSKLHSLYFEYFSTRELDFFRQSALRWLFNSPYEENIQFLIGEYDIGDFTARANNGLFTDAYLNLGFIGVILYPLFLTLLLKILEGSAKGLDVRILFVVSTTTTFVLLGVSITTALLTSGVFLLILIMYLFPRRAMLDKNSIVL